MSFLDSHSLQQLCAGCASAFVLPVILCLFRAGRRLHLKGRIAYETNARILLGRPSLSDRTPLPAVQGQKAGAGGKELGGVPFFTAAAELANGRVAMLGFAALLLTEAIKGSAVF